jgi:hypothetical protein
MTLLGPATVPGVEFSAEVALGNLNDPAQSLYDTARYDQDAYSTGDISWTVIGSRLESFAFSAGRDRWGSQFRGATGTLRLSNQDGIFNPDHGTADIGNLILRPGRFVRVLGRVKGDLDWTPIFTGRIEALKDLYTDGAHRIHSVWQMVDFASYLSMLRPPALSSPILTGQLSSDRVIQILQLADFTDMSEIETGTFTMQESTLSKSYWQECQAAASAEGGAFFFSKDGLPVFKNQSSVFDPTGSQPVKFTVGGIADEIQVIDADTDYSLGNVRNQITMARAGGTAQTVVDTTSQSLYKTRTHQQLDLENEFDADVFWLAERYRDYFAFDRLSIRSLRLVAETEAGARDLLGIELLDAIEATIQTGAGWSYTENVTVQGFGMNADIGDWAVSLRVESADRSNPIEGGPYSSAFGDAYDPSSTP